MNDNIVFACRYLTFHGIRTSHGWFVQYRKIILCRSGRWLIISIMRKRTIRQPINWNVEDHALPTLFELLHGCATALISFPLSLLFVTVSFTQLVFTVAVFNTRLSRVLLCWSIVCVGCTFIVRYHLALKYPRLNFQIKILEPNRWYDYLSSSVDMMEEWEVLKFVIKWMLVVLWMYLEHFYSKQWLYKTKI